MMKKKKILVVIPPENFRDEELNEPVAVFEKNGIEYETVSTEKGQARGMLGAYTYAEADLKDTLETIRSEKGDTEFSALMIVGGSGSPEYLWNNEELHEIVRIFDSEKKPVGAICLSPAVLANAGILKSREVTAFKDSSALRILKKADARISSEQVVTDGNIITANGPEAAGEFGRRMAEAFLKTPEI
jgi:protease I